MCDLEPCFHCGAPETVPEPFWWRYMAADDAGLVDADLGLTESRCCADCWYELSDFEPSFFTEMRQSVRSYVLRNEAPSPRRLALAKEWPLPVGIESLRDWALFWRISDPPPLPAAPEGLPDPLRIVVRDVTDLVQDVDEEPLDGLTDIWEGFPPYAFAGLVKRFSLPTGQVWLFGTIEHQGGHCWVFREPIVKTIVRLDNEGQVRKAASELEKWYAETIRGLTVGGRPKGPALGRDATKAQYESAITSLVRQGKRVTYGTIARSMKPPIGESTVRKYVTKDKVLDPYPAVVERLQTGH